MASNCIHTKKQRIIGWNSTNKKASLTPLTKKLSQGKIKLNL